MFHKKNNFGFTLIEAVVVSVIVAILAAVAIPIYTGYIRDAQQTTVKNLAETAAAAANAYLRRTGTCPTKTNINLYYDSTKYTFNNPTCNGTPPTGGTLTITQTNKPTITVTVTF